MKTVVICSGYFNPIHSGHIEYLQKAAKLGDILVVIVNNDQQRALKGSKEFLKQEERIIIVDSIKNVSSVFLSIDTDASVCKSIKMIYEKYCLLGYKQFIFAKGGDRFSNNIPELKTCEDLNIKIIDSLGQKIQSSSEILKDFQIYDYKQTRTVNNKEYDIRYNIVSLYDYKDRKDLEEGVYYCAGTGSFAYIFSDGKGNIKIL